MADDHTNDIGGFMDEDAMRSAEEGSSPEEPLPSFEQVLHSLEDEAKESSSPVHEGIEEAASPASKKEAWASTVVSSASAWTSKMREKIVSAKDSLRSSQLDKPAEDLPLPPPPPDSSLPPMPPAPEDGGAEIQGANSQAVAADGDPLSHPDTAPAHPTTAPPHPASAPAGGDEENASSGATTKGTGIPAPIAHEPVQEEKFEEPMVFETESGSKDPSKGQSSKRHNTTPTLISGALEETSAIPTIAGASGGSSKIPGQGHLIDPTKPTLIFAVVLTILAAFWSFTTAFAPVNSIDFAQSLADAQSAAHGAGDGSEEDGDSAEGLAPKISSVSVLSWSDDQGDHPEQAVAMIDGDSSTSWHSRWFENNQFLDESAVTLVVKLERTATVSSVTLEMDPSTSGGQLVVRNVTDPSNPRNGTQLTTSALSPSTEIKLPQPVETSMLALSFRSMPTSVDGNEWAWVSELSVQ